MKKKIMMSWSSGKDSAWALFQLQQDPSIEVVGLFCSINKKFQRVAMHGVRVELLKKQAKALSLPIDIIELPFPCSNDEYQQIMRGYHAQLKQRNIDAIAFGDLFLEDVKKYREELLEGSNIDAIFPLWQLNTKTLPEQLVNAGFSTVLTCINNEKLTNSHLGKELTPEFIKTLPSNVDPCGENGEFHTFVFRAPNYTQSIDISLGEIVEKGSFSFIDLY